MHSVEESNLILFYRNVELELKEEKLLTEAPKLTRQTSGVSHVVDLGSGVTIDIPVQTKSVRMTHSRHPLPKPLASQIIEEKEGVTVTVSRTVIGLEPLESLLDEFPDLIKETISKVLDEIE